MLRDLITDEGGKLSQSKISFWVVVATVIIIVVAITVRSLLDGWDMGLVAAGIIGALLLCLIGAVLFNRTSSRKLHLKAGSAEFTIEKDDGGDE